MMFIIHLLELFLFSVVYEGSVVATSKGLMNFNVCKRSTPIKSNKPNVTNVLDYDLFLQMPLMSHKGCFYDKGSWDATAIYRIDWDITSSCSCKCWKNEFFALRGHQCACLKTLWNLNETDINNCNHTCFGSKKDPCGAAHVSTVYEHTMRTIPTNTNVQPKSTTHHNIISKISTSALVTVRHITTDTNVQTSLPSTLLKFSFKISTPVYHVTKLSFHIKMINITVISVGLLLVVTGIVVIVILIFRKWNRITHYFHNNTHNGTNSTFEGDELGQMTSCNHRSSFRAYDVPLVFKQTHRFENYPATDYENFADGDNACQRLNFTLHNDGQQSSTEVHDIHFTARYYNDAKRPTKEGSAWSTYDEEQRQLAYRISNVVADEVIYDLPQDPF